MAKKGFSDFVPQVSPTMEPTPKVGNKFADFTASAPLPKESVRALTADYAGFRGDSQYDEGLVFGSDQAKLRAENQPFTHEIANAALKTVPGIALGIIENFGSLAELIDGTNDYDNAFTQLARSSRDWIENKLPTYRENPNEVFDLSDTAWWVNHGQGLVESVGEFLITGAGVGGALGKGAKALNTALRGGELGAKITGAAAQLATASSLAYTEGAMSGAKIYKDVLAQTGNAELAAESAAKTVRLNTLLNTGLNITGISPLFTSFSRLGETVKEGIKRGAKESLVDYGKRLGVLATQGVSGASMRLKLVSEALQEGTEESVNVFAEAEGKRHKQGENLLTEGWTDRFVKDALTDEGKLSFLLGSVGGVAQTAGMEYAPLRTFKDAQGNTKRVSARELEKLEGQKYQLETVNNLKQDIDRLVEGQQKLNEAIQLGDKSQVEQARNDLFNISVMRSLRTETAEELANEISKLATVDNTIVGPNGQTEAMMKGLADNIDDNKYKQTAIKKAGDIRALNQEYRDLLANYEGSPAVASSLFDKRLAVYSTQSTYENILGEIATNEANLTKTVPDLAVLDHAKLVAEVQAYNTAESILREDKQEEKADRVRQESLIARKLLQDAQQLRQLDISEEANAIGGSLISSYLNKLLVKAELDQRKKTYSDAVTNPKKLQKEYDKLIEKYKKIQEEAATIEAKEQEETKKAADYEEAKVKAQQEKDAIAKETARQAKAAAIKSVEDNFGVVVKRNFGPEVDLEFPYDSTEEDRLRVIAELQAAGIPVANRVAKSGVMNPVATGTMTQTTSYGTTIGDPIELQSTPEEEIKRIQELESLSSTTSGPAQLTNLTPITEAYKEPTAKEKAASAEQITELLESINNINTPLYGNDNKIAYKAQEQSKEGVTVDPFVINEFYKILHDPNFSERTELVLRVAKDSPWYKDGDTASDVAIGVYYKGKLVGYMPTYKKESNQKLLEARKYVIANGEITTTISRKSPGVLNIGPKALVSTNYALTPKFAIGRVGRYEIALDIPYSGTPIAQQDSKTARSGYVYTINTTPNGKTIMLPVDINRVAEDKVTSMMRVLNFYFKGAIGGDKATLSTEEKSLMLEVAGEYGYDLSTPAGIRWYFDLLFYGTNLNIQDEEGKYNVETIAREFDKSNHYVELVNNGIRFMKSANLSGLGAGMLMEYTKKDLNDPQKTTALIEHLSNSFSRVDLTRINGKSEFKLPVFGAEGLTYTKYSKKNYNEHVASVTSTNVVSVAIGDNKQTAFVQPTIHIDLGFIGKPSNKDLGSIEENGEKFVDLKPVLANKPTLEDSDDSGLGFEPNEANMTDQEIQEYKKLCDT